MVQMFLLVMIQSENNFWKQKITAISVDYPNSSTRFDKTMFV